jgi:nitrogen fixation/metabolism regulation signal transduction histidine kinase
MALDLHRRDCQSPDASESLVVATRQLELMERYLQRFLTLGRSAPANLQDVDLSSLVETVLSLVAPAASHAEVDLQVQAPSRSVLVHTDPHALEQAIRCRRVNAA